MVYGFARQSNGAFRLTSEMGVGTEAEIWLPRAAKSDGAAVKRPSAAIIEPGVSLNVLLVDDHSEVREATLGMLEDLGHKVSAVEIGSAALDLLAAGGACDLLISDYAMPNLSGVELIGRARKLNPDLPAMIITGYADNDALAERLKDVTILSKPFSLETLSEAIRSVMAGTGRKDKAAAAKR
jgi:CheY-like chemotaxis protein